MNTVLLSVAVVSATLVPMLTVGTAVMLWKHLDSRRKRRSPLTAELLRPPGYSLSEKLEELTWDLGSYLFAAALSPVILLATFLLQWTLTDLGSLRPTLDIYAVGVVLTLVFLIVRAVRTAAKIRRYREGLKGELATAQLLEPVIAGGGRVLHDIQADGFNIDHVAIAPGGVYAIETKHRLKPTIGRAVDNAKVGFDGKALRFPDWTDTTTADQAAAQARWLSERLSRATGLPVKARPVIALPGWFVENTSSGDVWAMNPKNCGFMLKPPRGEPPLPPESIQRITFQTEQLCRLPDPAKSRAKGSP